MFRSRKRKEALSKRYRPPDTGHGKISRTHSLESLDSTMSEVPSSIADRSSTRDFKLANIFWRAKLSCHPFHVGDPLVTFGDLWPDADQLRGLIACFKGAELQDSVVTCCKLVLRCGLTSVLRELLDQRIISIDQRFEYGMGLLHHAVLASNGDTVSFLVSRGVSIKLQDKAGRTADQLCYCTKTRRCLPARYQGGTARKRQPISFHDKKVIFELVTQADKFNDVQIMLQTMEFDLNYDKDQKGNLLLHAAVRGGLTQLALIINLVQVHGANIEATNRKGMTPLCIAAQLGLDTLVEILICVIGANPDTKNPMNGWTALHYAAKKNHHRVIDCLIKRGADMNIEETFSFRPDDIALRCDNHECRDLLSSLRQQRSMTLRQLVCTGNLAPNDRRVKLSDQYNVDSEGLTLIMAAAKANRCDNLGILLKENKSPINAQHYCTGRTALVMAAMDGNGNVIQTLLSHDALPSISDIKGRIALHYACMNGHVDSVRAILDSSEGLHGLAEAERLSNEQGILDAVRAAVRRRQREIVNPMLFECAMNGNAGKIYCVLEEGDDVNPLTGTSDWPMYMAVGNGHFEVIKLLQQYGGDVCRVHSTTLSTLLHVACSRGLQEIVRYLLNYCHPNENRPMIDINKVNKVGVTALQLSATKGYSSIVRMLLENGASTALVDQQGQLYRCLEYEGVQALIERHRKNRTERIMLAIKDRKRIKQLKRMWQPKFDHNLRNKAGDTPLMTACLNGRVEAVKFLLETAVQNTEEEMRDFERSMRWRQDSDSDSGTFLESCSPGTSRRNNSSDFAESGDYSDFDTRDTSALHPALHGFYPTPSTPRNQDNSSDSDTNTAFERLKKRVPLHPGTQGSGLGRAARGLTRAQRPYVSDTETLDNNSEARDTFGPPQASAQLRARLLSISEEKGLRYAPSLASIRTSSLMSLTDTEFSAGASSRSRHSSSNDNVFSRGEHVRTPSMSEIYLTLGQPSRPNIYQGSTINHVCATNYLDGSTAVHRAVQCSDKKAGLAILLLLLAKDTSVVNVQNYEGLTPIHLACKLDYRQVVKKLVSLHYVDLNIRTLDGNLPEQMAKSEKSRVAKLVRNARANVAENGDWGNQVDAFSPTPPASTFGGSSVDFDGLHERFEQMKRDEK